MDVARLVHGDVPLSSQPLRHIPRTPSDHHHERPRRRFGGEPRRQFRDRCGDRALAGTRCAFDRDGRRGRIEPAPDRGCDEFGQSLASAYRRRWSPPDRQGFASRCREAVCRRGRWPVRYCTRRACPRRVSDTSKRLAAPCAVVMPGTTSTAMPAARQAAISSSARPKIIGSPPLSRTTRRPALASEIISALMSSCRHEVLWPVLPTSIFLASRRAKSRMSAATRSSNRITSADCSARTARSVNNSGLPGPAPTRTTEPAWCAAGGGRAARRDRHRSAPGPARRARGR